MRYSPNFSLIHLTKHRAALFNQTNIIEFLLDKEAKLDARDNDGRSPFLNAVAGGHVESARLLLNRGADISATDLLMKTCVHIAVENEHLNMLVMLLDKRAGANNLNKGDMFDRVPLHYAATTGEIKVLLKDTTIRLNQYSNRFLFKFCPELGDGLASLEVSCTGMIVLLFLHCVRQRI